MDKWVLRLVGTGLFFCLLGGVSFAGNVGPNDILANAVTTPAIADGAVTGPKIADGAVTDAKIAGVISAGKISSAGLNADTLDGLEGADLAPAVHTHGIPEISNLQNALNSKAETAHNHPEYAAQSHLHDFSDILNVTVGVENIEQFAGLRVVHQGPADNIGTFNTIYGAIQSIYDPQFNKYAVVVMPGVYDESFFLPDNVSLLGVDKNSVVINISGAGGTYADGIRMGNNASISGLTLNNSGTFETAVTGQNVTIEDCVLNISGEGGNPSTIGIEVSGVSLVRDIRINFEAVNPYALKIGIITETEHAGDYVEVRDVVMASVSESFNNVYGIYAWGKANDGVSSFRNVSIRGTIAHCIFARGSNLKIFNSSFVNNHTSDEINYTLTWDQSDTVHTVEIFSSEVGSFNQSYQASSAGAYVTTKIYSSVLNNLTNYKGQIFLSGSEIRGSIYKSTGNSPMVVKGVNCFDADFTPLTVQ